MTIDLAAIKKRAEAATEGPWYYTEIDRYHISPDIEDGAEIAEAYAEHNAVFIAHARQDVPALIAEVERLRAGIDRFLYDISNEDYTDPNVVEAITEDLRKVYLAKEDD